MHLLRGMKMQQYQEIWRILYSNASPKYIVSNSESGTPVKH
jgi:hypothetical protein